MKKKVVLGMSGGVDSSVAAYLLQKEGYDVIGLTMDVISNDRKDRFVSNVHDAKKVSDYLGISHYVVDYKDIFEEKVINYFIDEYTKGRTPNPCVVCNKYMKFGEFLKNAKDLGADYIATGHYAKIEYNSNFGRYLLKRADDRQKDQTYFLYNLTQRQLAHTLMPLGKYTKDDVRKMAKSLDIPIYNKPDSEEICFILDNNYGKFLEERKPDKIKPGYFVDNEGNILGKHRGIVYYTIGQRKGLGIAFGKRVYVQKIIPEKNLIVLGDEEDIYNSKLYAEEINIIPYNRLLNEMEVTVKIRHTMKESKAIIYPHNNGVVVKFVEPQRAITKGQSVVFYDGEVVIGGGIIKGVL